MEKTRHDETESNEPDRYRQGVPEGGRDARHTRIAVTSMPLRAFEFADSAPAIRAALGFDADFFGTILATLLIIHSMFSDSDAVRT